MLYACATHSLSCLFAYRKHHPALFLILKDMMDLWSSICFTLAVYSELVILGHLKAASAAQVWEYLGLCLTLGIVKFPSYGCGRTALAKTHRGQSHHLSLYSPWSIYLVLPEEIDAWNPGFLLIIGSSSSVFLSSFRWGQGLPHVHGDLLCCMCSAAMALILQRL